MSVSELRGEQVYYFSSRLNSAENELTVGTDADESDG